MTKNSVRPIVAALFCGIFFLISCEKPEESIGLELQSEEELLNIVYSDTSTIITRSVIGDSLRTSAPLALAMIGELNGDGFDFGQARSVLNTQLRVQTLSARFSQDAICDSIVFALQFNFSDSIYGSVTDEMTFSVKELENDLFIDSVYYSNQEQSTETEELIILGMQTFVPGVETSVIAGDTVVQQLRLRLNPSFGQEFINADTTIYESIEDFLTHFKGVQVSAKPAITGSQGSMSKFDINSSSSKMTLYYHEDTVESELDFLINVFTQHTLEFDHIPGAQLDNQTIDPTLGQQDLYLQTMSGSAIEVDIPYLSSLEDSADVAMNKAELVFKVALDMQDLESSPPPERMFALYRNEEGNLVSIPDVASSDGNYDLDDNEYRLNITSFVQQSLTGEIPANTTLIVLPFGNTSSPNHVHIYGPENALDPAKLVVTYTKF